jgi:ABC-type transport system substrate-binding protein
MRSTPGTPVADRAAERFVDRSVGARGLLGGLLALPLLVACGDMQPSDPIGLAADRRAIAPRRGGVLRSATYTDLRSIDPAVTFDGGALPIVQLIFAPLLTFSSNPDDPRGTVVPHLAERFEVSADGLRITLWLHEDARFHDGSAVTAKDVVRSIERALHPDTPNPVSSFYERMKGYAAFTGRKAEHIEGLVILSEHSLAIDLAERDASFLSVLALPTIAPVCPSAGDKFDRNFAKIACGAGPYKLASWDQGAKITVKRFDEYFEPGKPYLDGIEWSLVMPPFTQRLKFDRGELDMIRDLNDGDLALYRRAEKWQPRIAFEEARTIWGVSMNTEKAPFDNVEVRRAVSAAINRTEVASIRPGSTRPASRLLPPAIPFYDPTPGQTFDYQAALEHMRTAGYPYDPVTKTGGYPKEIPYITVGESLEEAAAQVYQQQLARIGIRIRLRIVGWPAFLAETTRRGVSSMGSDGWAADYPDPSDFFEPLLHSKSIADEDSQNHSFYSQPDVDKLLDKARSETDVAIRKDLYQRAEQRILSDAPWAFVYSSQRFELWHPYVRGYRIHPSIQQHVAFTWLDEEARDGKLAATIAVGQALERLGLFRPPTGHRTTFDGRPTSRRRDR